MSTHATSSKQWAESDLSLLPIESEVRLRGLEVTRLDTFMDAAFAFVLTLLVISFDEIPANFEEMVVALKRIPGFMASFSVLMMFWLSHRRWSRRYGLETNRAVFLSLAIIFVVLVYVYPLRTIFEAMFAALSSGYFTSDFELSSFADLRGMFLFYSIGSLIMSMLFCDLYRSALRSKEALGLNQAEVLATKVVVMDWFFITIFGVISIAITLLVPDGFVPLAGYIYCLIYPTLVISERVLKSKAQKS